MARDINFNVVNDYDKNLSALAYVKAKCLFNLHGRNTCSPAQCEMCDVQQGFDSCMGELPVCDRLRVMTQADDIFASMQQRHMYYTRWRKATPVTAIERAAFGIKMFVGMLAMLMGVVLLIMAFAKMSAYNTLKPTTVSKYILPVLDNVEGNLRDTNGDGLVNCIDYAIVYKELWDSTVPQELQDCCEIVRNYNKAGGMNHLFIRVREDGEQKWLFLEPQGDRASYAIPDIWRWKYDPQYNLYGETSWWLARRK